MPISLSLGVPTKSEDFESLCLELLRRFWGIPTLELYTKRGERQFGVDILDLGGQIPIHAAQCKLKETHKSLPPSEIQAEVNKAKRFDLTIGKYAILTTGKISGQSQRKIRDGDHRNGRDIRNVLGRNGEFDVLEPSGYLPSSHFDFHPGQVQAHT